MKIWTEADFESMSWHDNHVHSIHLIYEENSPGSVSLDIDHILEWLAPVNGVFHFRTIPAVLTFRDVLDLHIEIDYSKRSAGTCPFSIDRIRRQLIPRGDLPPDQWWYIDIAWPGGFISFTSPGFVQRQAGIEVPADGTMLRREERHRAIAALNKAL